MSDVSGIYSAPLCLTTQHNTELYTAVEPSVKIARTFLAHESLKKKEQIV